MQEQFAVEILPKRNKGKFADSFKGLSVSSNHYKIELKEIQFIYVFKVVFTPRIPADNSQLRNQLLQKARSEISLVIKNPVFSGFTIFSSQKPSSPQMNVKVQNLNIEYSILIKQVKIVSFAGNTRFAESFFNNQLRSMMRAKNYVEIGKSAKFFNQKNRTSVDCLVMFSGYKANFQFLEGGLYLRVDVAKKFVRSQTVKDRIDSLYKIHADKDKEMKRDIVKSDLIGKTIMTNYGKTTYHRISDVLFIQMSEITFDCQGKQVSIVQYFRERYNIDFPLKQPVLAVENSKKDKGGSINDKTKNTFLIPSLCLMTGIPEDFDQMRRKSISQATIKSSDSRRYDIEKFRKEIQDTPGLKTLEQIGVKISPKLQTINAKIITTPILQLGQKAKVQEGKQSFFNLYEKPIYQAKHSIRVGMVYFDSTDVHQIMKIMEDTARNLKVKLQINKFNAGRCDNRRGVEMIESMVHKCIEKECNIALLIVPNFMKKDYKKIKQSCLTKQKILCQYALENTFKRKGVNSIITKILLQIIAKRGNTLWVPKTMFKHDACMMMAFDTSKKSDNSNGNIISCVASVNSTFTTFFSKCDQYRNLDEKFKPMFTLYIKAIEYYYERNKFLPKDIIILQNAVPRDQVKSIKQFFIEPTNSYQYKLGDKEGQKPNITFVMVNTKNDQRFFDGPDSRNPRAGTVVSEQVVGNNYDFYMVSQYTTKGCAIPNHYEVIYNDSKMEEGVLHELIYAQCFNYVNWTGSIKVPGALQYAKKCAKFHAQTLNTNKVASDLEGKLYYA